MKHVLLLKAGDAAPAVRLAVGDYDRWFVQSLGLSGFSFDRVDVHRRQKLPERPRDYDAVMMTGSPLSVTQPEPWMSEAADYLVDAAQARVPVLGVCFGHQLLGQVFGGPVLRNPLGRELGSIEVSLTPAGLKDPLFAGLPERFTVQATHEDIVGALPSGAVGLAANGHTALQAMAIGPHVRGVQFHPEASPDAIKQVIEARAPALDVEGQQRGLSRGERVRALLAGIRPSPYGPAILANFLSRFT
jgi:GMP synthase (glutamine-hydrolysing)